jgi:hypothetical protein
MSILKQNDNTSDRDLIKLCGFNVYQQSKNKGTRCQCQTILFSRPLLTEPVGAIRF